MIPLYNLHTIKSNFTYQFVISYLVKLKAIASFSLPKSPQAID